MLRKQYDCAEMLKNPPVDVVYNHKTIQEALKLKVWSGWFGNVGFQEFSGKNPPNNWPYGNGELGWPN